MFDFVLPSFARFCIAMKFGIEIAAVIPLMTATIISSIRVKPLSLRMVFTSWGVRAYDCHPSDLLEKASRVPRAKASIFKSSRQRDGGDVVQTAQGGALCTCRSAWRYDARRAAARESA